MDKEEWDYCGYCGRELKVVLEDNLFMPNYIVHNKCPRKHVWNPFSHDDIIVGNRPKPPEKTKFDRRTGGKA